MSRIVETHRALGEFAVSFAEMPQAVSDQLVEFGHLVVTDAREDAPLGDNLLASGRYVGVVRTRDNRSEQVTVTGSGLAMWLGDEDKKGAGYETAKTYSSATLSATITDLLPASVAAGTLTNTGLPPYTGTHQYQSPREAIDYVCDTLGAEWKISGHATNGAVLDAGPHASVFVATPRAVIVRRDAGADMGVAAFPGAVKMTRDAKDFTTRTVLIGEASGSTSAPVVTGSADIAGGLNPYKDLRGNTVVLKRFVDESATESANAAARAQLQLNRFTRAKQSVTLDAGTYEMQGVIAVGDMVWVWDPEAGMTDANNEIIFRGERLNPAKEQVVEMTWSVVAGMGVYYRSGLGVWIDLTDWVEVDDGKLTVSVGDNTRDYASSAYSPIGRIGGAQPDTSIPGAVSFVTPFPQSVYLGGDGVSRAQVQVRWNALLTNVDTTSFVDGSHYEIRYRPSTNPAYPALWAQAAATTWGALGTWGQPITTTISDWQTAYAGIDQTSALISELQTGVAYDFQIRALDSANPPNAGAWSSTYTQYTAVDVQAPNTPAAPEVSASKISIGVLHRLGDDTGGTFNLALDLAWLEVHIAATAGFTPERGPDSPTFAGKIVATQAHVRGRIPVVATFPVDTTQQIFVKVIAVDVAGNPSNPSAAASVTAELIDSQWISDLVADRITSGTLTASIILGGEIATATSGQRVRFGFDGIEAYLADGVSKLFDLDIATQTLTMIGEYATAFTGQRIRQNPGGSLPDTMNFYPSGGGDFARIMARTAPSDGSAAILIDGGATGTATRGRLGAYRGEAFVSCVNNDSGGDTSVGYSLTALSCNSSSINMWTQSTINFDKYSGSSIITQAHMYMKWVTGSGGSNMPILTANDVNVNAGIKFDSGAVLCTINEGSLFGPCKASAFTVSSTAEVKTDIVDIRQVMTPLARLRAARSKAWRLADEVAVLGPAARLRFGPIAEDLPAELVHMTPSASGPGLEASVSLGDQIGTLWGAINELDDQEIRTVHGSSTLATTMVWAAGSVHDVPLVWDAAPLDRVKGAIARMDVGVAWQGKLTAKIKDGTVTDAGCTVTVTVVGAGQVAITAAAPLTVHADAIYLYSPPYAPPAALVRGLLAAAPEEP